MIGSSEVNLKRFTHKSKPLGVYSMVKKNFGVITVDLKESRKLRDRALVQSRV